MIRVLLADDQAPVRKGFRLLLESADDITVVGEAANGGVAVSLAREHAPDVVLMDLRMPEVDGPVPAGSWSRTSSRRNCCRRSASSPAATRCSRPA